MLGNAYLKITKMTQNDPFCSPGHIFECEGHGYSDVSSIRV